MVVVVVHKCIVANLKMALSKDAELAHQQLCGRRILFVIKVKGTGR